MAERLDTPKQNRRTFIPRPDVDQDAFGKISEGIARFMGTPRFIVYLTLFCIAWIAWNVLAPANLRFDTASNGFTALTLMLSLQASYAAPLILLAQNRQTDRDRVSLEQDRQRAERNLADTEFLAREVAALRIALSEVATRDFVRSELRDLLEDLARVRTEAEAAPTPPVLPALPDLPDDPDPHRRAASGAASGSASGSASATAPEPTPGRTSGTTSGSSTDRRR